MNDDVTRGPGQKRHNIALWVFIAIISYFLITEHWAHIVPYLPWLLLAACPLMHVFMHGSHEQKSHDDRDQRGN